MDPSGSDLDSSLPQPENPCLIVEDSQPDSVALEDDPESSYRALLARRLSILQPASRSPVLELISSPLGSRSSQTDSQSTSDTDRQPCGAVSGRPVQNSRGCADMDPGADSTTNCVQPEGDSCHLGFLELSQSQDLQAEEILGCPSHTDKPRSSAERSVGAETQSLVAPRSEVSSSSSSGSVWQANLQVLSRAPNASGCAERDLRDQEILSSQEDLFDADKTGAAVDSTVSQSDQQGHPSLTPAHTLRLLHLSGQGTLVQDSLSQNSGDYVGPTPDSFPHTPLIVPSSPTEPEPPNGAGDAMDTSKPQPSASTPVSQSTPGFAFERLLPVPSQPEFSHDVFAPTQSQKASQPQEKSPSSDLGLDPAPCSTLQLSESCSRQERSLEEDSQATQIEAPEEAPSGDISPCRTPGSDARGEGGAAEEPTITELDRDSLDVEDAGRRAHSPPPEATPSSLPSQSVISQPAVADSGGGNAMSLSEEAHQHGAETDKGRGVGCDEGEEEEPAGGPSGLALVLSQSQLLSPEHMEEGEDEGGERPPHRENGHAPISNSLPHKEVQPASDGTSQTGMLGRKAQSLEDKSLSDSSADMSFHFTLPKDGELTGPPASATPPLVSQLGQTLRHSTPIETASFSEKSDVPAEVAGADSPSVDGDGKLSLRMKLVTPVEEGSSERFSLQKPALSEEDAAGVKVATVSMAAPSSPSVFTRVRQVHRQREAGGDLQPGSSTTAVEEGLSASPKRSSQMPSRGCSSLPSSQPEPLQQGGSAVPQGSLKPAVEPPEEQQGAPQAPEPPRPGAADPQKRVSQQAVNSTVTSTPSKGEPESPLLRRAAGPAHHRHVRTIQEVRTTITRIITDVYYEDGREVDRRVTEESEEPVVDCQVLEEVSPCRTGSSSVTLGDLADISSLSSKASSLQHSSGGTSSSTGPPRPDFVIPPSRGARSMSPRRGGGHLQRGHRGNRVGSVASPGRGFNTSGSRAFLPMTPRGRARRGRPPSRSFMSRGGAVGSLQRTVAHGHTPSSSEEEPYTLIGPPLLPVSPTDPKPPSRSDSLRSSPEVASSAGSSFVGLRVVAKWSSNGYFYSGRIMKDAGEGRFRLRFDDGYECEVAGRDILLCDPIPVETEVTALLEDEYFSVGVVKGHRAEGSELFYSIERDGQRHWHNRTAVILSLDQGNRLREQHSLGPYETSTPLTKASDISLDNLVEGKRRRKGTPGGAHTPNRSSSSSPRTPGPSGKRKLMAPEENRTPSKRGRRGGGSRAAQRFTVCNTSGSGTELPGQSGDPAETHGPLPQNASLFMGFAFMLTASSETDRLSNLAFSEDEEDYVQTGPYNKAYTESQLQAGGGFILPDFNEEQCQAAYQSLLIADQHCRTRKYLLCVSSGVPCVSHIWVRDCCRENKLLNYRNYLLPAGAGPDGAIVEWHPRCSPFKALHVLLLSQQPQELWAQLATMGGASSVRQLQVDDSSDIPAGKFDVAVTDHTCPPQVRRRVTSQEVPVVPPEWLIQSLICGKRMDFRRGWDGSSSPCSSSS
ncbi:TP53-binding protein 1 isoform X1 [Oryzias latipes]|uniref:TP53-binding protein 1 isoform X1 n=2 Tax=Oryzias latipes TaxID=8090 RepID=UPI0009DA348D|nr:TP53-binding protein 1 isoform X1 [Oryzias latipes]